MEHPAELISWEAISLTMCTVMLWLSRLTVAPGELELNSHSRAPSIPLGKVQVDQLGLLDSHCHIHTGKCAFVSRQKRNGGFNPISVLASPLSHDHPPRRAEK
ncbi:unnamed protein product [Pleuronectes platessa]|uniref:Secreted protein n=1 Tax=Pleuronectes platessa TaxID=8262 RepID=A0A9N7YVZ2_PLEPL|nr:unnamed protein product [Pleuronectes platessa]